MSPEPALPATWQVLPAEFRRCFSSSTFPVFCALTTGLAACTRFRTVTGMLIGAGMNLAWRHERAHRFFSRAVWCTDHVGMVLARLILAALAETGAPVVVAIDDNVTRRSGKKVHGAFWQYNGSATGTTKTSRGNCFVTLRIVVHLPFLPRAMCLPVLARLYVKDGPGKAAIAAELTTLQAAAAGDRPIHVVADAAYHGKPLHTLPEGVSWTCRIPRNAVLYNLAPERDGKRRGRPRTKGERLGQVAELAACRSWKIHTLRLYDKQRTLRISELRCLWYGSFGARPVRVIWVRAIDSEKAFDLALVTTDLHTPAEQLMIRYSWRWSIEQAFLEARHLLGVGQARNRTEKAVERTLPLGVIAYSLVIVWYARHAHATTDVVAEHRRRSPWYRTKTQPSFDDMLALLRRTIIAARFSATPPSQADPTKIEDEALTWAYAMG
ncbi:transposase [Sphaerisporangium sp. NPDC051017]|uniref:IS701 family transposase n=1 Tax=Sphaerisporangium sp. NPDC051017 TaxID=3154636 RepID=UPI003442BD62